MMAEARSRITHSVAMGTRFLMTRDCPVPEVTKARYVGAGLDDIVLTTRLDGLQHRLLRNEVLAEIEHAGGLRLLVGAGGPPPRR